MSTSSVTWLETSTGSPLAGGLLAEHSRWARCVARLRDYVSLCKPRIGLAVVFTVAAGYALGVRGNWQWGPLWHALVGIGCVASASAVLNQWWERDSDARMFRTSRRPLPAGRVTAWESLGLGLGLAGLGLAWLLWRVNGLTAGLTGLTLVSYVGLYTPLKRRSSLSTAVGAIPGALPPVLGWTAAGAEVDAVAWTLFAMLFLWQFPHFLAIAWMHREDYARAGLRMLPADGKIPGLVGWMAVAYALALTGVSLSPAITGDAGALYGAVAGVCGLGYVAAAVNFARRENHAAARGLLRTSLVYWCLVLVALVWDHWRWLM